MCGACARRKNRSPGRPIRVGHHASRRAITGHGCDQFPEESTLHAVAVAQRTPVGSPLQPPIRHRGFGQRPRGPAVRSQRVGEVAFEAARQPRLLARVVKRPLHDGPPLISPASSHRGVSLHACAGYARTSEGARRALAFACHEHSTPVGPRVLLCARSESRRLRSATVASAPKRQRKQVGQPARREAQVVATPQATRVPRP